MPDDVKISEMSEAASLDNSAQFPYVQSMNGNLTTLKAPLSQIGTKINEGMTFSNLQTTSKNIVGAINEAAQGGGVEYATELPISSTDPTNTKAYIDTKTTLVKSASGSLIHITDGGDNIPMKSLESEIVAVESGSGEKSPTNPYTISGFDNAVITRLGKNLIPMTVASVKSINTLGTWSGNAYTYNNVVFTLQTDTDGNITGIVANGTASATSSFNIANNYTLQKGSYILNGCPSGGGTETARLQVNSGTLNIDTGSGANFTLTEVYNSCVCFIRIGSGYNPNGMVFKPMVRVASDTDDTFAISKCNTYTFTFGQTVYGGYFDNKGNLVVTHSTVDLGSLTWGFNADIGHQYFSTTGITNIKTPSSQGVVVNGICSDYPLAPYSYVYGNTQDKVIGVSTTGRTAIYDTDTLSMTAEQFKTAMSGVIFVYELATPITLAITSQDIPTLSGENNIFSNCGDTDIEYFTSSADGLAALIEVLSNS